MHPGHITKLINCAIDGMRSPVTYKERTQLSKGEDNKQKVYGPWKNAFSSGSFSLAYRSGYGFGSLNHNVKR